MCRCDRMAQWSNALSMLATKLVALILTWAVALYVLRLKMYHHSQVTCSSNFGLKYHIPYKHETARVDHSKVTT